MAEWSAVPSAFLPEAAARSHEGRRGLPSRPSCWGSRRTDAAVDNDREMTKINGWTAPGFEGVRDVFQGNFDKEAEDGAAYAAYRRGQKVMSQIVALSSSENRAIPTPPGRRTQCSPISQVLRRSVEDTAVVGHALCACLMSALHARPDDSVSSQRRTLSARLTLVARASTQGRSPLPDRWGRPKPNLQLHLRTPWLL